MARHEMIEIPQFDFVKQCRKNEGEILTCKDGDIVIIEGIHGLNPLITADYSDLAAKIYVELQACVVDEETEICSDKLRMLRRIMRDSRFRAYGRADGGLLYEIIPRRAEIYPAFCRESRLAGQYLFRLRAQYLPQRYFGVICAACC